MLGLRWQDVDLDVGTLTVRQPIQEVDGEWDVGSPKSSTSRRTIPLPGSAVAALKKQQIRQAEDRLKAGEA